MSSNKVKSANGECFESIYPGTSQVRTFNNVSAQSSAFGDKTSIAQFYATEDVWLKFGTNPTALSDGTSHFLPNGVHVLLGVIPGQKVAAIRATANDGSLYITEGV